jgi:outer membrane protein assembly factor BamB
MRFLAALPILLLATLPAAAVIMKLTRLAEVLESEQFILVAAVEKIDPEKPSAVFAVEKALKGKPPFDRIPVNMTGDDEARKANDTKTILDRLDNSRKVVLFISKRGQRYNAMAFVEGSWFSLQGTIDDADKSVRWGFLHGEPYLRRTFKGTSAELVKVIEDGLAKKAKPPEPDEKEQKGYGPPAEKKCGIRNSECGIEEGGFHCAFRIPHSALFAVIPSFALVGPLAIVAALFPGVFARMAIGMTRWRAFLVVASLNSTLALIYFFIQKYLPNSWWFGPQAFTLTLMLITAVGLSWAGRRYRRMAAQEPRVTALPGRVELWSLVGLSLFAGACVVVTRIFASWETNLELPLREFTFIGIALAVATIYAFYRTATARVDLAGATAPDRRLSLSGETVGLGVLLLCGLVTLLNFGPRSTGPTASGTTSGDAETIGPRLASARVFEVPGASQVMSGLTLDGDRLYFGTEITRLSSRDGNVFCLNRDSGEVLWKFGDDEGMLPAFCTPSLHDGKLFCGEGLHSDRNCRIFCIDAATGKSAWEKPFQTSSHTEGAPAVVNGKVFFPAGDDGLYAADARTGTRLWQFPGGKERGIHIDAAPAVKGNRVFAGSGLYSFVAVCLDTETGNEIWRTDLKLRSFGAPFVLGKHVYFGVGTGNMLLDTFAYEEEGGMKETEPAGAVVCLDIENGKQVWRADLDRAVHTGLAGDSFSVYAACRDGFVYAFDRKTGKLRWKTGIGGPITAAPAVAVAGGTPVAVYAVSQDGNVACINPHTGGIAWQRRLPAPTEKEPGFQWDGRGENGVFGGPVIATTLSGGGSQRAIYIGAMTVDPFNPAKKTAAIFRFDDEIGGE